MFPKLVTYHVHKNNPLPANDALAYQYILAGNGVFIRSNGPHVPRLRGGRHFAGTGSSRGQAVSFPPLFLSSGVSSVA